MADHEPTRQAFEDRCWQHYMAERQRRDMPGDVVDEFPTREQLFWRQPGGAYGVLMFNAAWQGWCWALEDKVAQQEPSIAAEFDVRKIMVSVSPGEDGMGHEVYAASVADVEGLLTSMGQELEEWQLGIRRLPTAAHQEPPQPVERKPMTEQERREIILKAHGCGDAITRTVRHHGIRE